MEKTLKSAPEIKYFFILFFFLTIWWIMTNAVPRYSTDINHQIFAASYGIVALLGGIVGITVSLKWGGLNSLLGKAIFIFSLGLLAQEFGQLAYSYYIYIEKIEVPYPSVGDIGYFSSILFYIYGVVLLAKVSGVSIGLQSYFHRISAIIIPLIILISSYIFFLKEYQFDLTTPLKTFLDFGYPLGQAIYISLAILTFLLSGGVLGGMMKKKIQFIILALSMQYVSDYTFLYQVQKGTWTPGGINDYMYLVSYFFMAIALIEFSGIYKNLHK